jgi:hypothetical protein
MTLQVEFSFDNKTYRHYMNGFEAVLHCHHYMTLLTRVAGDYNEFGGYRILAEAVEDSVRPIFDDYVQKHGLSTPEEKLTMAQGFYEVMGMGVMEFSGDADGGEVTLTRSHVDQGWISKFGQHDQPINYWTRGYLVAMAACAFDRPPRSYAAVEEASIVKGEPVSRFTVTTK